MADESAHFDADTLRVMFGINDKFKSEGMMEHAYDHALSIRDSAKDSKTIVDSYGNSLLSIGNNDKTEEFTNYGFNNDTLNWTLWTALYNDSWVFKRAIDKPAQDEIRCGVTLHMENDKSEEVYRELKKQRSKLIELLQWGALYGGAVACCMFDGLNDEDYAQPMRRDVIRKQKTMKLYVTDRWYGLTPSYDQTVTNMSDVDFGKPMYYTVTLADGHTVKFHHSYVLRYEHLVAPQFVKRGQLQGWGYAEGSHIINELARDDKLKCSIQSLIDKSLIEIIKMSGMRGIFMGTDNANKQQLTKRLEMVNWGRNYNSLTFLDKEDEYSMNNYSGLSGLSDLLEKNMWLIASALEMQGILFGDLKGGFSNDTEALERYDEVINSRCETYVRPVMQKLIQIIYYMCGIDEKVNFDFNSLLMRQHDEKKVEATEKIVDLITKILESGAIDLKQYATILNNYVKNGTLDLSFSDEDINKLDDKMKEEMENIDLSSLGV